MILRFEDGRLEPWPKGEVPTADDVWETGERGPGGLVRVVWHVRHFSKAPYGLAVWCRAGEPYPTGEVIAAIEAHSEAALSMLDRLARESVGAA